MVGERLSFVQRLMRVVVPTSLQVLLAFVGSLTLLIVGEWTAILDHIGISGTAIDASRQALAERFSSLSHSLLASNIVLIAFWSTIGLVTYVICWWGYNLLVEARNEVTVKTRYENQGEETGILSVILIKIICGSALVVILVAFKWGANFALKLAAPLVGSITLGTILSSIFAILLIAGLIYLVIVFTQLVFSGWYHPDAFTD